MLLAGLGAYSVGCSCAATRLSVERWAASEYLDCEGESVALGGWNERPKADTVGRSDVEASLAGSDARVCWLEVAPFDSQASGASAGA